MKYCIVTTVDATLRAFVIEAARYHKSKGFEVVLISNMSNDFLDDYLNEFECVNIDMVRGADFRKSYFAISQLYKIFKERQFDVVQFATPNASLYASIASWLAKVPVRLYCQWGIRYVGFKGIKRIIYKSIEKLSCLLSTNINSASPKNMAFAVSEGLYRKEKCDVIGIGGTIGVDLSVYNIANKNRNKGLASKDIGVRNSFVFGFVGSIRGDKGSNELLRAFKRLQENNDNEYSLVLVGNFFSGDPVDDHLIKWANAQDNIFFTGPKHNVDYYMSSFDALIHPSYREGFSMVIQEALAMGIPVITTDIPGPSEVIVEEESGLLVPSQDHLQLESAMFRIFEDQTLRSKLIENGLNRCYEYFDRRKMLELTHTHRIKIWEGKK